MSLQLSGAQQLVHLPLCFDLCFSGARFPSSAVSSHGVRKNEGFDYIDENGHVTCKRGYRKPLREIIPARPYKGMWQNMAGCYSESNHTRMKFKLF